jgi:hypothetical protein
MMIRRLNPLERIAKKLLEARGYSVMPVRNCFISRYLPVNLMGLQGKGELLYLKLKLSTCIVPDIRTLEIFGAEEIHFFRTMFRIRYPAIQLHFEIWIIGTNGDFCCFEILPEKILEVPHA